MSEEGRVGERQLFGTSSHRIRREVVEHDLCVLCLESSGKGGNLCRALDLWKG